MAEILPFAVLRDAYQMALDTVADNGPGDDLTVRDYWPACIALARDAWLAERAGRWAERVSARMGRYHGAAGIRR